MPPPHHQKLPVALSFSPRGRVHAHLLLQVPHSVLQTQQGTCVYESTVLFTGHLGGTRGLSLLVGLDWLASKCQGAPVSASSVL